jgi:hypothetical protein
MIWCPPGSRILIHISLIVHGSFSPNSSTPKSSSREATVRATRPWLIFAFGLTASVCDSSAVWALVSVFDASASRRSAATVSASSTPSHSMKGVGNNPMTSSMAEIESRLPRAQKGEIAKPARDRPLLRATHDNF